MRDFFDPAGNRLTERGANVVALDGSAEWAPEGNPPAGGKRVCRDVATGVNAQIPLE